MSASFVLLIYFILEIYLKVLFVFYTPQIKYLLHFG